MIVGQAREERRHVVLALDPSREPRRRVRQVHDDVGGERLRERVEVQGAHRVEVAPHDLRGVAAHAPNPSICGAVNGEITRLAIFQPSAVRR